MDRHTMEKMRILYRCKTFIFRRCGSIFISTLLILNLYYMNKYESVPFRERMNLLESNKIASNEKTQENYKYINITNRKIVILLSSLPRSGSTFTGQLLTTLDAKSCYIFEPLHPNVSSHCPNDQFTRECISKVLEQCYTCDPNAEAKRCQTRSPWCLKSSLIVIKLIRGGLYNISKVLETSSHDIKVIHLLRDPRGAGSSVRRFGWYRGPEALCQLPLQDMNTYDMLSKKFPGKLYSLSYEQFCLNYTKKTNEMYNFIYGKSTLPPKTKLYLKKHTTQTRDGALSTYKETETHYQEWRKEIRLKLLREIESSSVCRKVISKMGHSIFKTIGRVRNLSIPMML